MIGFILDCIRHPLVLAAGVVLGAAIGWAGLRVLWADVLAAGRRVV